MEIGLLIISPLGEIRKGVKHEQAYCNFNQYLTTHYYETLNKTTNFIKSHYDRILHP
jgi:hypothetical protein